MKTPVSGRVAMVMLGWLLAGTASAAQCLPGQQQVNTNNNVVMLGGTGKGPVRQFVLGEFGRDVDQQKRVLGSFDRCGALIRADISYDKREGSTQLKLVQEIVRTSDGWRARYELRVFVLRGGAPQEVRYKRGSIEYLTGRSGSITSASDSFELQGEPGFTTTVNQFDRRQRLTGSVMRGSDANTNDRFVYRWDSKNQLASMEAENMTTRWRYDAKGRELGMKTETRSAFSSSSTSDECQLWDDRDNCTLSYSREMEVFPGGMIRRNISAAYRFEYWDRQ